MKNHNIVWFDEVDSEDLQLVGGKGANLGEMIQAGIPVPYGFIVTSKAYFDFIQQTGLEGKIKNYLNYLDPSDTVNLKQVSSNIKRLILSTEIPKELIREIMFAYVDLPFKAKKKAKFTDKLSFLFKQPFVAIRSSATAEDLPTASFAGQQETFLNVRGEVNVADKVRQAWASLFTERAIFYREEQKIDHLKVGIAVPVQLMVNSDLSGVMFTVDPVTSDKTKITIEAIYGLGEFIVQGVVTPDHFEINKKTLEIVEKKINSQTQMLIRKNGINKLIRLKRNADEKQKVTDEQLIEIAKLGVKLEKHYFFPQDVEWAIEKGNVYIVQTRPVTTIKDQSSKIKDQKEITEDLFNKQILLLEGDPASPGIASGMVKILHSPSEIDKVSPGDVLVATQTNPDYVPAMKKAVAIITEKGGRTSHAAIVSRELGIPAIVGAEKATTILKEGQLITVDGSQGKIYSGAFLGKVHPRQRFEDLSSDVKTATKVYVNIAQPSRASEIAKMNVDGIGLLRAEFMVADIGIHPKKLISEKKQHIFINKLASDLLTFAHAFSPRPVIYRATDFKTNEYRNLQGGTEFEPVESNPMMGYRGAFRYICDPEVFQLELEAIKKIRNKYAYKNLHLMIPYVRSVNELVQVKKIISSCGLTRSSSFKLWMMVEIPSNVLILDKFLEAGLDGISIGSNDLTMLILGTDRDNEKVANCFDERNEAVLWAVKHVIKICHQYKVTSSICGQAPSDYPDLIEKLVKWGITSVSVNIDAVDKVRKSIYQEEKKLVKKEKM